MDILGLITGLVFFIATMTAYTVGLKHGKQLAKGNIPKVNLNPVKAVVEVIEQKKEEKKADTELEDIMSATREGMLEAIKKAR